MAFCDFTFLLFFWFILLLFLKLFVSVYANCCSVPSVTIDTFNNNKYKQNKTNNSNINSVNAGQKHQTWVISLVNTSSQKVLLPDCPTHFIQNLQYGMETHGVLRKKPFWYIIIHSIYESTKMSKKWEVKDFRNRCSLRVFILGHWSLQK